MKKAIALILTLVLSVSFGMTGSVQAQEAEDLVCVDGSYLLDDASESTGEIQIMPRGYYLKSGTSTITKPGDGKIGVGGSTTGQRFVDEISVTVKVQWLDNGVWRNYHTWSAAKTNAAYVSTSKELTVPRGYYYRVSCSHYASSDSGHSYTDALYIK